MLEDRLRYETVEPLLEQDRTTLHILDRADDPGGRVPVSVRILQIPQRRSERRIHPPANRSLDGVGIHGRMDDVADRQPAALALTDIDGRQPKGWRLPSRA